ncbi:MAG: PAS domain S-box protein, partial [Gammaproteobacteria bacterium]|nr:PAS domain S-box protein [Gammaproteobacteria bacterium]
MSASRLPAEVVNELLHAAADAAIVTDGDGTIVFLNRGAETLFGYAAEELVGKPVETLIPEDLRARHTEYRQRYKSSPRARPLLSGLDLYGLRKDGSRFRAEIALTPVDSSDGLLVAGTIRELNTGDESEAYFRMMLETAPDAMIIVDE